MEEVKIIFKRAIIVTIAFAILGLITRNTFLLFGLSGGCIVSIISLYMISMDVKAISYCKDTRRAKKIAYFGYAKRYALYMFFLAGLLFLFDDFKVFLGGAIGLLNVKFNVYLMAILEKIKKYLK